MSKQESPKRTRFSDAGDLFRVRKDLKLHHKILYVAMVFVGLNLCWYGVWTSIEHIPLLRVPIIAILAGVMLLLLTGKVRDLT